MITPGPSPPDTERTRRLLHELEVHQIELEMQNEELRKSRALVEAALARYTELYDFSPLAYFSLDRKGTILQTNLAGARLLGVERARLTRGQLGAFIAPHDLPGLNAFLGQVLDARPAPARELRLAGNHEPPRIVSIEATLAHDGLGCNAVVTDITTLKAQQQQLERIAHYDLLTNLPNRVLLADRLQHAMLQCQRRGRSLAVAYLDLDGFKEVNDRHGHKVGDDLLVILAQRMKAALRGGDTWPASAATSSSPCWSTSNTCGTPRRCSSACWRPLRHRFRWPAPRSRCPPASA